jgi:outer membrane protein
MRLVGLPAATVAFALWGSSSAVAAETTRSMSIDDCVALALRQNPDLLGKDAEVSQAEAEASGAEGRLGPRLHVDANVQQWNSPFNLQINLGSPTAMPPSMPTVFPVRDAFTWLVSASLIQPLTGLWPIYENYKLQDLGVDVAKVHREATRRDVAFQVTEAYLRTLELSRLSEVAAASVDQLNAQLKESQSLYANGVVSQTDVLRAQVAVANARQRVIQLRGQTSMAHAHLATAMGMPTGSLVEPQPLTGEPPAPAITSVEEAERRAVAGRVELREIDKQLEQANKGVHGAEARLLPEINLVGNYSHNAGSAFVQPDAGYIGATASWDVWDWGATIHGIGEAKARTSQVLAARAKVDETVRLDVRQAFVDVEATADGMDVAKTAVAAAEENYRLTTKRYEAAAATAFDVIDAEGLLTQARGQMQTSLYDYVIACAALDRAIGIAPHTGP